MSVYVSYVGWASVSVHVFFELGLCVSVYVFLLLELSLCQSVNSGCLMNLQALTGFPDVLIQGIS